MFDPEASAVSYKKPLIGLVVLGGALTAVWVGLKSIPATLIYSVEAEFAEMPADDKALEEWLRTQPGVAKAIVGQREGEPRVLVVWLIMVRDGWGRPPFPDLEAKCDELGYRGRAGRFRDSTCREDTITER
jgi:hypothetical protein